VVSSSDFFNQNAVRNYFSLHATGVASLIFRDLIPEPTFENMESRHCALLSLSLFSRSAFTLADTYEGLGRIYCLQLLTLTPLQGL
jgi:hypothetical protein